MCGSSARAPMTARAAAIGARPEIDLGEHRIDLLLRAPNLQQLPVHRVAKATGTLLS